MSNPWFRLYAEFAHDPKVQMLSEVMQRRYVMLMCMRCSNDLVTLHETEIAFHLRISDEELASTKALFIAKGFIDPTWNLLNWEKRQFASDSSAARVAKHRALKKQAEKQGGNVDETLQQRQANGLDTDTDTDTDKKKDKAQAPFEIPDWMPVEAWNGYVEMRNKNRKSMTDRARRMVVKALDGMRLKGIDVAEVLDNSTRQNWTDVYEPKGGPKKSATDKSWLAATGFDSIEEAANFGCRPSTAHLFRDGRRIPEAA